jgi:hypothetical protein
MSPVIVQPPLAANESARPDDADALTAKSGSPNVVSGSGANVIVWSAFAIANVCATFEAALKFAFPCWDAVIVHEPAPVMCTLAPETVQFPVGANDTGNVDEAVALTPKSESPYVFPGSAANAIVWLAFVIEKVRAASGAAK